MRLEIKAENEQIIIMNQIARKTNSKILFSKLKAKRKLLIIQKLLVPTKRNFFETRINNSTNINNTT